MTQAIEFLHALAGDMPEDERLILCAFLGDPADKLKNAWRPHAWRPGRSLLFGANCNAYVTTASFRVWPDGTWRRRAEAFAAGRAFMIDDLGTKIDLRLIEKLPPSALIETSPGNFQAWYLFMEPMRDRARFDGIIRAFIERVGTDPGMSGVTRVGRIPGFANGKRAYGGAFRVRTQSLDADRRYAPEQIVEAFGLRLTPQRARGRPIESIASETLRHRAEMFAATVKWMRVHRMLKREDPDLGGWVPIQCPWSGEHTGQSDTGAAIRVPSEENGFYGAFRCHHGHCAGKGWAALTDWIADEAAEQIERINNAAQI